MIRRIIIALAHMLRNASSRLFILVETKDKDSASENICPWDEEHYEYMLKCGEIVEVMTLRAISILAANDEEEYNAIINNSMHLFIGMIGLTRDDSRVKAEREANLRKGN